MKPCFYQALVAFLLSIFFVNLIYAQKAQLKVAISSDRLQPNERLDFSATYTLGTKKLPPATFAVVLKENDGDGIWQMRWPMLDGVSEASIFIPPSFPKGKFTFYFAVQPRFFRLFGQVLYPSNAKSLEGTIFVNGISKTLEIPVDKGLFEVKNLFFENTAVFKLNYAGKVMPAIALEAWLDSSFIPAASGIKEITIGLDSSVEIAVPHNTAAGFGDALAYFDPFYVVRSLQNMTDAQKFDSIFVSPSFKKNTIQQFTFLSDSSLLKAGSLEKFLDKYFPGFKMHHSSDESIPMAYSKIYDFVFKIDEQPASFESLNDLILTDIAAIKVLPKTEPERTKKQDKKVAVIALYTRKGLFILPNLYRHNYIINGYQPSFYELPRRSKFFANNPCSIF